MDGYKEFIEEMARDDLSVGMTLNYEDFRLFRRVFIEDHPETAEEDEAFFNDLFNYYFDCITEEFI